MKLAPRSMIALSSWRACARMARGKYASGRTQAREAGADALAAWSCVVQRTRSRRGAATCAKASDDSPLKEPHVMLPMHARVTIMSERPNLTFARVSVRFTVWPRYQNIARIPKQPGGIVGTDWRAS